MKFASKSIINLPSAIDREHSGELFPVEYPELPFEIIRVFWITHVPPKGTRGGHAHKKCMQFYICIKGCIAVKYNDGKKEGEFFLKEGQAVLIDKLVWTEETFLTGDDILLVLCSHKYDGMDYINTASELKEYIEHGSK